MLDGLVLLNRVLSLSPAIQEKLKRFSGKVVALRFPLVRLVGQITEDGLWQASVASPETEIQLSARAILQQAFNQPIEMQAIHLKGNAELGAQIGQLLAQLRLPMEEAISWFTGDWIGYRLGKLGRGAWGFHQKALQRLWGATQEYAQEEGQVLPRPERVTQYIAVVDALRDDTARLEKRLEQLERRLQSTFEQKAP